MNNAIADLMNEHETILSAIQIIDGMISEIEQNLSVDQKDIQNLIHFLKEFADKCHHGKEEGLLFSAMVKAGVPEKGGPIGVMLSEHAQGRQLIRDMEAAISNGIDCLKLTGAFRGYASLLRVHIQKENGMLFPMAERALTEGQLEAVYEGFEKHEEEVMGQGRHEELQYLLKTLQEKYRM